jgi:hypothetical protein
MQEGILFKKFYFRLLESTGSIRQDGECINLKHDIKYKNEKDI